MSTPFEDCSNLVAMTACVVLHSALICAFQSVQVLLRPAAALSSPISSSAVTSPLLRCGMMEWHISTSRVRCAGASEGGLKTAAYEEAGFRGGTVGWTGRRI